MARARGFMQHPKKEDRTVDGKCLVSIGVPEICLAYAAKDPRVRYYRMETNLGSIANFSRVFQLSNAPYFFWASGHDIRHETFMARCVEILEQDTSVVLCYSGARWLEPDGRLGDVMSGHVETRGMSQVSCFRTVIWGLGGFAHQINGIMRSMH